MFSHITFGCSDIKRSSAFYDALLAPLGIIRCHEDNQDLPYAYWADPDIPNSKFFICLPFNGADATPGNGTMVAFNASSASDVGNAHRAGLLFGGSDEGAPGPRPQYGDHYYGAYLRDPDGNKIHLAYHGSVHS